MPIEVAHQPDFGFTGVAAMLAGRGKYKRMRDEMLQRERMQQIQIQEARRSQAASIAASVAAQQASQGFQASQTEASQNFQREGWENQRTNTQDQRTYDTGRQDDAQAFQVEQFERQNNARIEADETNFQQQKDMVDYGYTAQQESMMKKYESDMALIQKAHAEGKINDEERKYAEGGVLESVAKIKRAPLGVGMSAEQNIQKNTYTDPKTGITWYQESPGQYRPVPQSAKPKADAAIASKPMTDAQRGEARRKIRNDLKRVEYDADDNERVVWPTEAEVNETYEQLYGRQAPAQAGGGFVGMIGGALGKLGQDAVSGLSRSSPELMGPPAPAAVTPVAPVPAVQAKPLDLPPAGTFPQTWAPQKAATVWAAMKAARANGITDQAQIAEIGRQAAMQMEDF